MGAFWLFLNDVFSELTHLWAVARTEIKFPFHVWHHRPDYFIFHLFCYLCFGNFLILVNPMFSSNLFTCILSRPAPHGKITHVVDVVNQSCFCVNTLFTSLSQYICLPSGSCISGTKMLNTKSELINYLLMSLCASYSYLRNCVPLLHSPAGTVDGHDIGEISV